MMHAPRGSRKPAGRTRAAARGGARQRRISAGIALALALLGGCPSARYDLRADPALVRATDPSVETAYRDARARFDRGELPAARDAFRAIRVEHAADPIAPTATLWEARADLAIGEPAAAVALVEPLASGAEGDPIADRARFLLGLALARNGDPARARSLLQPFASAGVGGDDGVELCAALAESNAALGNAGAALADYERFYDRARPVEQAYIRARVRALVTALDTAQVIALYQAAAPGSLARAALAARYAGTLANTAASNDVRNENESAARRFGLVEDAPAPTTATDVARAVGLVIPLSGKNHLLGERALRGALVAAGTLPLTPHPLDLRVRDSGSRPEQAAAAVEELAQAGVIAVVGSPDRAEAAAIAARAAGLDLPIIDLAPDEAHHANDAPPEILAGAQFHLLRPNTARAEALAEQAIKARAKRVAVLAPDNPYGKKMSEAFAAVIQQRGGTVVADLHFAEKATTFIAPAKQLAKLHPDAVFVPATAGQLELIAAQLAAAEVIRFARTARAPGGAGGGATLYATADGLGPRFVANAARFAAGAVLAPVFYPDERALPATDLFRRGTGEEPGAFQHSGIRSLEFT